MRVDQSDKEFRKKTNQGEWSWELGGKYRAVAKRGDEHRELTGAALWIPGNEEGLALNDIRAGHRCAEARNKRSRDLRGPYGAYGVPMVKACAVDATAARRVATENNFIAALYDEWSDQWGPRLLRRYLSSYVTSANLRSDNSQDPGHPS
jgi:hypothetical protein